MKDHFSKAIYYSPYQPGFEKKLHYHNFMVSKDHPLYGIVSDFYQFDSIAAIENEICVIPDGCVDFLFKYSDNRLTKTIEGFHREKIILPINQDGCAFGVRFCPGAFTKISKIHASELIGCQISLSDLLGTDFELYKMEEANDFKERIEIMKNYILKKLKISHDSSEIVQYCIKKILQNQGNILICELAQETNYTMRYLRGLFFRHVGISPKELSEIIKFQNSFISFSQLQNEKFGLSLSNFAIESGYYDQSHMNKSYQKIAGCLPKKLYVEMSISKNY